MVEVRFRSTESVDPQPLLQWDSVLVQPGESQLPYIDWQLAGYIDPTNWGGLLATQALNTAILIQLATWRRAEPGDKLDAYGDPYGWWGDSVDVDPSEGEGPIGSRLWLLYRSPLNDKVAQQAVLYAQEALQTLVRQGAVASVQVTYEIQQVQGILALNVICLSHDGTKVYNQKFSRLWAQNAQSLGAQF